MKWVKIEGFPDYEIAEDGQIFNTVTERDISTSGGQVLLYRDGKQCHRSVQKLVRQHFSKPSRVVVAPSPRPVSATDKPRWRGVQGFPNYRISNFGEVERIEPYLPLKGQGPNRASVLLHKDGKQYMRGIRKLTRDNWGIMARY